jgi:hypothetical protein
LIAPGFHFFRRFLLAVIVEPIGHFLIRGAFLDFRFEIVAAHALETEKHVVEGTIEMILADVAAKQRATFVVGAGQNYVAADAHSRAPRRLLGEILALNLCVHGQS